MVQEVDILRSRWGARLGAVKPPVGACSSTTTCVTSSVEGAEVCSTSRRGELTSPERLLEQIQGKTQLEARNLKMQLDKEGRKGTHLVASSPSSLPRETDGIRVNPRGGAELTGGAAKGSSQLSWDRTPEEDMPASSKSTSASFAGDEAVAESPPLRRFFLFRAGSSSSSSSSTPSL